MRRRWHVPWAAYATLWLFVGFVPVIVTAVAWPNGWQPVVAASVWVGPYVLAVVWWFLVRGMPMLWELKPQRVWEPILTDLRERHAGPSSDSTTVDESLPASPAPDPSATDTPR